MSDIDTWPHTPSARATIPSGEDAGNPNGWTDNLLVIKTAVNSKLDNHREDHTYAIPGEIKVASGSTNYILPFFVGVATGEVAKLALARYIIRDGTSVTCKLTKNGVDITGFTGISVTKVAGSTDPTDVDLADGDLLALVVTAVSGTPVDLTFTIHIDYSRG